MVSSTRVKMTGDTEGIKLPFSPWYRSAPTSGEPRPAPGPALTRPGHAAARLHKLGMAEGFTSNNSK